MSHYARNATPILLSALLAALGAVSCERADETSREPEVRELRILQPYADGAQRDPFSRPQPTLHDILNRIWDASEDENVRGLLLRVGPLAGAWGSVGDLIEALDAFRGEDRPVHCHFETADNVAYLLLASTCDRISMSPAGMLDLTGPAVVMIYARSLLAKLGIEAEIIHMGRYKGAGDMFIRDDMPPETKESMDAILDDLYTALVNATKIRTQGDENKAKARIDAGPYVSGNATEAGLVDGAAFLRDARDEIRKATGVEAVRRMRMVARPEKLTLGQFLDLLSGEHDEPKAGGERVALVYVTGNIVEEERSSRGYATSGPFIRKMERLAKDDDVKAVVMRVNSPGGSALASDRMWEAARQVARAKPLIASVGDMAASGGYYIASAADEILAHPNSVVGSIGVVGGKFNFEGLAEDIGVNTYVLQRGKRAAWSTPIRGLNPNERQAFEALLRDTYERFVSRVAEGRGMERDKVLAAAEGRVMTGQDGKGLGLIDEMGGLGDAMDKARELGGLAADSPVEVWPPSKGMLDAVNELLGENGNDDVHALTQIWISRHAATSWLPLETWRQALATLGREHIALVPPFFFALR